MSYCFDCQIGAISKWTTYPLNGFGFNCDLMISLLIITKFKTKRQFATKMTNIFIYLTIILCALCCFLSQTGPSVSRQFLVYDANENFHLINYRLDSIEFNHWAYHKYLFLPQMFYWWGESAVCNSCMS